MNKTLRALIVEDCEYDAELVVDELRRSGYEVVHERVDTAPSFLHALDTSGWDLIIADYSIPGFGAVAALSLKNERNLDLPFIIVSGTIGEDQAVAAMKAGAHDYLLKGRLARLGPAVERELRDARTRRERSQAEQELRDSRAQLRALAAHLQSVREEERKLIAREIHDELGQSLTGFKMDLAWMRNRLQPGNPQVSRQPLLDKIAEMGGIIDGAADLIRKICTELRPGILDDLGVLPAMEWQAREFQKRTRIECALKLDVPELDLEPERSTALFRIFQEILTNVARHAAATRVSARLHRMDSTLVLEVTDNGRGISESRLAGEESLGIIGMKERALLFGGEVTLRAAAGKGTTVTVRIPLPPATAPVIRKSTRRSAAKVREAA
jgi:signal transduction histidine kinase